MALSRLKTSGSGLHHLSSCELKVSWRFPVGTGGSNSDIERVLDALETLLMAKVA